jgi:hypothetical protein
MDCLVLSELRWANCRWTRPCMEDRWSTSSSWKRASWGSILFKVAFCGIQNGLKRKKCPSKVLSGRQVFKVLFKLLSFLWSEWQVQVSFRKEMGGDWVTMGVLYYKAQPKSKKSGNSFSVWELTDLRHSFKLKVLHGTVPQSVAYSHIHFWFKLLQFYRAVITPLVT